MVNDLRNCPKCGRLFAYQGRNLCKKCQEEEENEYLLVRKYVRDNPGATIFEVSEATGVEEEKILQFLREGRLQSKGLAAALECERCGKKISAGRFCPECIKEMDAQIKGIIGSQGSEGKKDANIGRTIKDRMYTRETDRK
ncbi:TIGR03826 family flagellar region protein [Thermosyntropha sp.]|uniref:TIGR03826 family flagellar region protein n=1 Tax=Thermosyntropha sp. TaxID=2740820 RepID=UPI0025FD51CC|nr:TIGR03826 family flagellar region protein [Thermosyntropha sp.]MBO8159046.1 MerR family transcriptional regulator [Thermosyntropha sp.]